MDEDAAPRFAFIINNTVVIATDAEQACKLYLQHIYRRELSSEDRRHIRSRAKKYNQLVWQFSATNIGDVPIGVKERYVDGLMHIKPVNIEWLNEVDAEGN